MATDEDRDPAEDHFRGRWQLDDASWMRERKRQWAFVKENLISEGKSTKQLKHYREFFLEGIEPPYGVGFGPDHRLAFTPCASAAEVRELFDAREPHEYAAMLSFAMWGLRPFVDETFGYAGGQEALIARALFPAEYQERTGTFRSREYLAYVPAEKFVDEYEQSSYRFLTTTRHAPFFFGEYTIEHYLSCVRHLEQENTFVEHHDWLSHLLSCVFNFVEPRVSLGRESAVSAFAGDLAERLLRKDVPTSIAAAIEHLGPYRLAELSQEHLPEHPAYFVDGPLVSDWAAPLPRVLHWGNAEEALSLLLRTAQRIGLLPDPFRMPQAEAVDLAPLVSEPFKALLGYGEEEALPAYHVSLWYEPDVRISNQDAARFGADLFLPIMRGEGQEAADERPSLIYFPRLSGHYRYWYPTEVLLLKERQHRREIFDQCGQHLLNYSEDADTPLDPRNFANSPYLPAGFHVLKSYKSGSMELALEGPDVRPWTGDPLPKLEV